MQITTQRLILRRFTPDDFPAYYAQIGSDAAVMRYIRGAALSEEEFSTWIPRFDAHWAEHDFGVLAIIHREEQRLIGHTGLKHLPPTEQIEVLYALGQAYWGQGLASEAAAACLRWGFETLEFNQIAAVAMPENTGSRHVMEKNRMVFGGLRTDFYTGAPLAYYTLNRADFSPTTADFELIVHRK